jgi:hypothetical protein
MAQAFPETAHNKTDLKKYKENFDSIDWGDLKEKPIDKEKAKKNTKHSSAGLCGEYGMSTFDKEEYGENFDNIDWSKK